ncbi:hypothetical protein [Sphingomonas bacterium]|uniref:hypothetical protein n=1 Tax=Sphingomonas bacterium TaxID=1895847 RepID=UPI001575C914|nr:hypothetical protein [Sphingomonas bacterium]
MSELVGYVDSVVENIIAGWATDAGGPVHLNLYIDEVLVSRTPAVKLREDLKGKVSEHGCCGFNILVPVRYCDGDVKDVKVVFSGTTPLTHGALVFQYRFVPRQPLLASFPEPFLADVALNCLKRLSPMDVVGGSLVRVGRAGDGGYIMLDENLRDRVCYSLGINDDVAWDLEMASRNCAIHQYDHTIEFLPETDPAFHWERVGIAPASSADGRFASIPDLIHRNGHADNHDMILKCDIEGHEWSCLAAMEQDDLARFSQIVMEIHGLERVYEREYMDGIYHVFDKLSVTHQLVHVHGNNNGIYMVAGGVGMPAAYEVTYVRREGHRFETSHKSYPTALDEPCTDMVADFYLGKIGLINV